MDVTGDEGRAGALGARCDPDGPRTHAPPRRPRDIDLASGPATRIVLGDWYDRGTVLVWDEAGCRLASPETLPA